MTRPSKPYCDDACAILAREFDRLQALYEVAGSALPDGALPLEGSPWAALVMVSDAWSDFRRERAKLYRGIKLAGLPTPQDPRPELPATA